VSPCPHPVIRFSFLISFLSLSLTACANNPVAERWFAPDPKLQESPVAVESPQPTPQETTAVQLPANFPAEIPRYPNAKFLESEFKSADVGTVTRWQTSDTADAIAAFYAKEFPAKNWEIVPSIAPTSDQANRTLVARQQDLQVTLSIPASPTSTSESTFEISYNWKTNSAQSGTETPSPSPTPTAQINSPDRAQIPEPARQSVEDLTALGVFPANSPFEPNKTITRGEFARWLVSANNSIYANNPSKQIRLIPNPTQPAFKDVPKTNANFAHIQGLAEAGLIPSPLSGNPSAALFQLDAPLTRENLVLWKVPLDSRQGLPKATLEQVQQTWGFQDTAKIDPLALRALVADYQNGEQANVRRAFGFTTLFQPKKPVTQAEAATALWFFGYQGDGVTAKDALQLKSEPKSQ
jgi:S-layer homology domain